MLKYRSGDPVKTAQGYRGAVYSETSSARNHNGTLLRDLWPTVGMAALLREYLQTEYWWYTIDDHIRPHHHE